MFNIGTMLDQRENCVSVEDAIKVFQYYRPFDKLDESCFNNEIFQHKLIFALDELKTISDVDEIIRIISKNLTDIQYQTETDLFVIYEELKKRDLILRFKDSYGFSLGDD